MCIRDSPEAVPLRPGLKVQSRARVRPRAEVDAVLLRPALAMSRIGPALAPTRPRPWIWEG
eukprot:8278447-Alexandrium_andersonii.AAC.1